MPSDVFTEMAVQLIKTLKKHKAPHHLTINKTPFLEGRGDIITRETMKELPLDNQIVLNYAVKTDSLDTIYK